jgi:hypothetical protein
MKEVRRVKAAREFAREMLGLKEGDEDPPVRDQNPQPHPVKPSVWERPKPSTAPCNVKPSVWERPKPSTAPCKALGLGETKTLNRTL